MEQPPALKKVIYLASSETAGRFSQCGGAFERGNLRGKADWRHCGVPQGQPALVSASDDPSEPASKLFVTPPIFRYTARVHLQSNLTLRVKVCELVHLKLLEIRNGGLFILHFRPAQWENSTP